MNIIDLCFLCTKDNNCIPVDDNIVFQVEYLLPEITIIKLGIPLRICSVCNDALYSFSKFKQFCVESSRRLETSIKGAQGPSQNPLPPERVPQDFRLHTDSNNTKDIVVKKDKPEETQIQESCNIRNKLMEQCSSPEHNTEGSSAASDTSVTSVVKTEIIEEIIIKEEHLEEQPEDMNTYNMLQCILKDDNEDKTIECDREIKNATLNTSETSHTKPELTETIFIKEEHLVQPENIISNNADKSALEQSEKDNQIEQYTSAESAMLDTSDTRELSFENSEEETEIVNQMNCSGQKIHQCDICTKIFKKKCDLDRHKKIHFGIKDFHCEICLKSFSQKSNLVTHMKTHYGVKDFRCDICSKAFMQKPTLINHMKSHSGIKEFVCEICNKSFSRKVNLTTHMAIHSGVKDFQCDICNKSFMQHGSLTNHMKTHSSAKSFQCDVCNKSFTRKFDLIRHNKIHTGVKDFHCDICNKSFTQKTNLVAHMKIHAGVRDYYCDLCGKSFTQHGTLVNHIKIHSLS